MRKAVVGGAAVAVLVVVGLLVLSDGGVPLIPGRGPTGSDSDPGGFSPGGPTADASALDVRLVDLDLAADDLSALVGPRDSTPPADLRAPVEFAVGNPRVYFDAEVDSLDGIAELDRHGGEVRSELDGSTRGTVGALASVLLALMVLKAACNQGRDRRLRAVAPALAA